MEAQRMTNDGIPRYNKSGCADPTAYKALTTVQREQDESDAERRANMLISALRTTIELSGFELLARIEFRDKTTGRCFR
jgi:hypothetical protein